MTTLPFARTALTHQLLAISAVENEGGVVPVPSPDPHALAAMSSALGSILSMIKPSRKLLAKILAQPSVTAVSTLLDTHGAAPYISYLQNGDTSLMPLIKQSRIDLLEIFHIAGFDLSIFAPLILQHAIRHNRAEGLSFVRGPLKSNFLILDCLRLDYLERVIDPILARELAGEIHTSLASGNRVALTLLAPKKRLWRPSPKLLAIQLASGIDILNRYGAPESYHETAVSQLIRKSASQHGRLALRAMEPSLSDVLARSGASMFFGLESAVFRTLHPNLRGS